MRTMTSPTSPSKHLKVKDQIWWHGVNISEKLKVIAHEHPVQPLARRQPQWQSVSSFFTRAAVDLASEQPGRAEARTPLRHTCTSRLPLARTSSKNTLGGRPKSAAGSKARLEPGRHRKEAPPAIRRRPQSAPALLRNDEPGLIAKKTHKDPLRQHMEDLAVHERMEWLKREGHTKRELIAKVDVLADPILFDLKVLHNSAARAKTAPHGQVCATPSKAGRAPGSANQAERLRGLSRSLANDTHQHMARLQIPHRVLEGGKMQRLFEKLKDIEEITSDPCGDAPKAEFHHGNDMALKVKPEIGGAFAEQLKGLWGNAARVSPGDLSHPLVRLAYFLNGQHPRRMRMVLEAFDCACKGSINQEDFCTGLELMSYQSISEYKELFFMLDSEGKKELEVGWLEEHLKGFIDADDEPS